jgi:phage terminase small subunit
VRKVHAAKAGNTARAAAERKARFVEAYLSNGHNQRQAAITAGIAEKTSAAWASRAMKLPGVAQAIAKRLAALNAKFELSTERTLREVARIAYADPRKFFRPDGSLIPVHELGDDTAACLASMEISEIGDGENVIGTLKKIKHWDKIAALEKAMKYLGLFERDNAQQGGPIDITVKYIRPKARDAAA